MKKISICFLTLLLLFVTGCKNNQQEINCVLNNNTKYQIFSQNNKVNKVILRKHYANNDEEYIDNLNIRLNETYKSFGEKYGGVVYNINKTTKYIDLVVNYDYSKINISKLAKDNSSFNKIIVNNKIDYTKLIDSYVKMGAQCK